MARKSQQGVSPTGKMAIIAVLFGVPILFFASSYGLSVISEKIPVAIVGVLILVATAYTAHTSRLMYTYYEVEAPILRFIPCLCEVTLMDQKFWVPCYSLYGGVVVSGLVAFLPYSIAKVFGEWFVENHVFVFGLVAFALLLVIQVIKGIGLYGCINDIAADWNNQTRSDVGFIKRFAPFAFIPFVRVIALYGLNKPLSTMVDFMNVSVSDAASTDGEFYEDDEGDEEEEDEDY